MSTVFHLFSLPYVPLKQVFDNFGPTGIFNISMTSRKSKNIAVSYRGPSKNVQFDLGFGVKDHVKFFDEEYFGLLVQVLETSELPERTLATVRIGNFEIIPVEMGMLYQMPCLKTYWKDRMVGLFEIGKYVREVFNRDIYKVMLGDEYAENDHRRAIDWVLETQKSIEEIYCEFTPRTDEDFEYLLEKLARHAREFSFVVKPSDGYCPVKITHFMNDDLYLQPSFWIKLDHLLTMNCRSILLADSTLTYKDINLFLKHWMSGGCFELKNLDIRVEQSIDYETTLNGTDYTKRDKELRRDYETEMDDTYTIKGGFDIKRSIDDVMATVLDDGANSKLFRMLVWPDFAENSYC
ncbi:hypothetical protein GCK72_002967 [Caenorhabditis remanei]|uniref:F-box domain-containing protein n=1 Tax=Caenorhabditis remanei TaxID=31234 RepID=A0A6A5HY87_CAERE|nr:hypothetical protein GCK72_002967 [Caenorhabditis remanei]KAF1771142.1 hypothetical protein GCK72_002967 [Caenorhabditis remanei]